MTAAWLFLSKIPIWVWLALLALGVIVVQHIEVDHYKAKTVAMTKAVKTFDDAQKTNLATIATLEAANKLWADGSAAKTKAAAKEAADAQLYAKQQQDIAKAATNKLRALYAHDPAAKAWSDAIVPPDVAEQLRAGAGSH